MNPFNKIPDVSRPAVSSQIRYVTASTVSELEKKINSLILTKGVMVNVMPNLTYATGEYIQPIQVIIQGHIDVKSFNEKFH